MTPLGNGLSAAEDYENALTVGKAELSMLWRFGAAERDILVVQGNLAGMYNKLGQNEQALNMYREVYSGHLKLLGEEHGDTLAAAYNYVLPLIDLRRPGEVKSLMRKTIPVARRILSENSELTLSMNQVYALALYDDDGATLVDVREAVTTLEDSLRISRRVLGGAHPLTMAIELNLKGARMVLSAHEAAWRRTVTPPGYFLKFRHKYFT